MQRGTAHRGALLTTSRLCAGAPHAPGFPLTLLSAELGPILHTARCRLTILSHLCTAGPRSRAQRLPPTSGTPTLARPGLAPATRRRRRPPRRSHAVGGDGLQVVHGRLVVAGRLHLLDDRVRVGREVRPDALLDLLADRHLLRLRRVSPHTVLGWALASASRAFRKSPARALCSAQPPACCRHTGLSRPRLSHEKPAVLNKGKTTGTQLTQRLSEQSEQQAGPDATPQQGRKARDRQESVLPERKQCCAHTFV